MSLEQTVLESKNLIDLENKLNKIIKNKKTKTYFFEASIAKSLLDKIRMEKEKGKESIKFIAYPNNSGIDIYKGNNIEDEKIFSEKFGWKFYELG